ncbi:MAG: hypothetical protein ACTSUK_01750 [Promethearchaeota archaeon]
MGMNYYHRTNACSCCNRYDEAHIGKSSYGWTFSFKGNKIEFDSSEVIVSFEDWKKLLKNGKIFDEEDKEISFEDFVKLVESKEKSKYNHTTYCLNSIRDKEYAKRYCWLDDDGHSFSGSEFI